MAISLKYLACGNCKLNIKGICDASNNKVKDNDLACWKIQSNFEDKGFICKMFEVH